MSETPPRPLPPPPRPHHRRDLPRLSAHFRRPTGSSRGASSGAKLAKAKAGEGESEDLEEEEELALQPPPRPHAHPLEALATRASDGRAVVSARRLDPEFLNPARVAAFLSDKENEQQQSLSVLASGEKHSTRAIERHWRFQLESGSPRGQPPPLTDDELRLAATDAAKFRKEIKSREAGREEDPVSELARARERKVKKQLDPEWVRTRSDPANRPRRAAERTEERGLYESLGRLTMKEIARRRQQYQDGGDKQTEWRESNWSSQMAHRGFIGMPGSCFDSVEW